MVVKHFIDKGFNMDLNSKDNKDVMMKMINNIHNKPSDDIQRVQSIRFVTLNDLLDSMNIELKNQVKMLDDSLRKIKINAKHLKRKNSHEKWHVTFKRTLKL